MATIAQIVYAGKGVAHAWRVVNAETVIGSDDLDARALIHYSTVMLAWTVKDKRVFYLSTGHGSVSDQNGVNTALRVLGGWFDPANGSTLPEPGTPGPAFYFSRAGSATYRILDRRYSLIPIRGGLSTAFSLEFAERT